MSITLPSSIHADSPRPQFACYLSEQDLPVSCPLSKEVVERNPRHFALGIPESQAAVAGIGVRAAGVDVAALEQTQDVRRQADGLQLTVERIRESQRALLEQLLSLMDEPRGGYPHSVLKAAVDPLPQWSQEVRHTPARL